MNEDTIYKIIMEAWKHGKASSYNSIIKEYRKQFPESYKYGLKDDTIKRIVRDLNQRGRISRNYIDGQAYFSTNLYWGVIGGD